jgi:hypothetical protein
VPPIRLALIVVVLVLAVGVLWVGGELHRENCQRENRVGCSVLPWDNGEQARLTDAGSRALRRAGVDPDSLPSECR